MTGNVSEMVKNNEDLTRLPGIGKELAAKIKEIVETGSLAFLKKLETELPPDLTELLKISGLGPHKVGAIHKEHAPP